MEEPKAYFAPFSLCSLSLVLLAVLLVLEGTASEHRL